MFRGSYQRKLLTVLYSGGSNPLEIWDIKVKNGWTRRVKDEDMGNIVFEIAGTNVATAYIVSPPDPRGALGISLPFITMYIKNLKRYFTFEIQILDDKHMRRRFRFSNYQSATKVRPFTCSVPLALKPGWNQMQLNLANFTMRAYGTNYMETQRVQIHANCRIRRVYFSDRLYAEEELPREYRVYLDVRSSKNKALPVEKVASITRQPLTLDEPPPPPPPPLTPEAPETLIAETSYKSVSNKSVAEMSTTIKPEADKSISGTSMGKRTPSLGTLEFEPHAELGRHDSVVSKRSKASKTSHVTFTFDETGGAITEEVNAEDGDETYVVEQSAEVPEHLDTEDETSPRTETVIESEYAESELILESDVEELTDVPTDPDEVLGDQTAEA